jgi:hypothetical protein
LFSLNPNGTEKNTEKEKRQITKKKKKEKKTNNLDERRQCHAHNQ